MYLGHTLPVKSIWDTYTHTQKYIIYIYIYIYIHTHTDCISAKCPGYDTKQSNGEAPVMLELWGMQSTSSLPLLPCPLWSGVGAPDRIPPMGQVELLDI